MRAECFEGINGIHNVAREVPRMRRRETHATNTRDFTNGSEQLGKCFSASRIAVSVHVLP